MWCWLVVLVVLWSARADAEGLVFVHPSGRVAYQARPGRAKFVLFERGRAPSLSPDGKRIAYWVERAGPIDHASPILIAELATRKARIWRAGNLRGPRFSPDGTQLLFTEIIDGRWAVLVAPIAHPEQARVLSAEITDSVFEAVWLPDGRGVLAHDLRRVYWFGLDGKLQRQLELDLGSSALRVLPCPADPECLLYDRGAEGTPALARALNRRGGGGENGHAVFRHDLATGRSTRLTGKDVLASEPAWSRDGQRIYFVGDGLARPRARSLRRALWSMRADGSDLRRLGAGDEPGL